MGCVLKSSPAYFLSDILCIIRQNVNDSVIAAKEQTTQWKVFVLTESSHGCAAEFVLQIDMLGKLIRREPG